MQFTLIRERKYAVKCFKKNVQNMELQGWNFRVFAYGLENRVLSNLIKHFSEM